MRKLTKEAFITRAFAVHNRKYSYPNLEYKNNYTKIQIFCPIHGIFEQKPNSHLDGHGCVKCIGGKNKSNHKEFLIKAKKMHGDKYEYLSEYTGAHDKLTIRCRSDNYIFHQKPNGHLRNERGGGCPKCAGKNITTPEFLEKIIQIHGNKYKYSKVKYINSKEYVCIICLKHGQFEIKANYLLSGTGCPKCSNVVSKQEDAWLFSLNISDDAQHRQVRLKIHNGRKYKVDGYDPSTNTVYEFFGDYFHGNPRTRGKDSEAINKRLKKTYGQLYEETQEKIKDIQDSGYNLVYIWEDEWKETLKHTGG